VPQKPLAVNSRAQPFQKFFMTESMDQGNKHQKVLAPSWNKAALCFMTQQPKKSLVFCGRTLTKRKSRWNSAMAAWLDFLLQAPWKCILFLLCLEEATLNGFHVLLEKSMWPEPIACSLQLVKTMISPRPWRTLDTCVLGSNGLDLPRQNTASCHSSKEQAHWLQWSRTSFNILHHSSPLGFNNSGWQTRSCKRLQVAFC
jgi:hypothetical protein